MNRLNIIVRLVDQLRKFDLDKDIDLPEIGVFGGQSSGKSSVLEALLGAPLPRSMDNDKMCDWILWDEMNITILKQQLVRSTHEDHMNLNLKP